MLVVNRNVGMRNNKVRIRPKYWSKRDKKVSQIVCMNQGKEEKQSKAKQGEDETISLQALFICLCVCFIACAISSLVLLTSNIRMLFDYLRQSRGALVASL